MRFSRAIKRLEKGKFLRRPGWPDGVFISVRYADEELSYNAIAVYLSFSNYERDIYSPWCPGLDEMIANDWEVLNTTD
mgnify:CR=1 FL=1